MLDVHIDPNGDDHDYQLLTVPTFDDALKIVRERFPNAVHAPDWQTDAGRDSVWFNAMLEFWPDPETMDGDDSVEHYAALVFNQTLESPYPHAPLFSGDRELPYRLQ